MTTMMTMLMMAEDVVLHGDCVAFEEKRGERVTEEWSGIEHDFVISIKCELQFHSSIPNLHPLLDSFNHRMLKFVQFP